MKLDRPYVAALAGIAALGTGSVAAVALATRLPSEGSSGREGTPTLASTVSGSAPVPLPLAAPSTPPQPLQPPGPIVDEVPPEPVYREPVVPLPADPDERVETLVHVREQRQANMMAWLNRRGSQLAGNRAPARRPVASRRPR